MRRKKLSRRGSRKYFSKNSGYHPKNNIHNPMRGGFRL